MKHSENAVPISSTRGMRVALTVASLASVIFPSGLIATSASRLASIIERAASNASFSLVMSRVMVDAPTTAPSASRIGETVSKTGNTVPSFRERRVSKGSTSWPALILARMEMVSSVRPSGLSRSMDVPSISSRV